MAYCPRLFFLEWVQGRFTDNADTVDGRFQHRVIDAGGGRAPEPERADDLRVARSVLLSSPALGLVGRVDLLDGLDGAVIPVDYKRGTPPAIPQRAWEPERVQVCALGMILRDNGYRCDRGALWFAATRERVDVPFTDELVERTAFLLAELRAVALDPAAPPPLVDSPKCPRCSLVGLCLPDEHNTLAARTTLPPRRLMPRDDQARPLYVSTPGARIGIRSGRIEVTRDKETLASVRAIDVSQVCVQGNVQVTTQALRACFDVDVPVLFQSHGGWLQGVATGLPSKHVELRRRQVIVATGPAGLDAARRIVHGKIRNSRVLLRRNTRSPALVAPALASMATIALSALEAATPASLLGFEGAAARLYFGHFGTMVKPDLALPGGLFEIDGRNRRPPRDPLNCLLSYAYALLTKDLVATTIGVGLDPYLGVYHRPRFGRPALALDLAEEFRPLVADSVVLQLVNNGEVSPRDFVVRAAGVTLTPDGRRAAQAAYERRLDIEVTHPIFGYRITYRRVFEVQARLLAAWMLGEVPNYAAFTTR